MSANEITIYLDVKAPRGYSEKFQSLQSRLCSFLMIKFEMIMKAPETDSKNMSYVSVRRSGKTTSSIKSVFQRFEKEALSRRLRVNVE